MGLPVVHFEISSPAAAELRAFYADAFGWKMAVDGDYTDIRTEGTCPGSGDHGIDGGLMRDTDDFVTFYVQVPDVAAALADVERLGGTVELPETEAGRVVIGMFRDPRGNRIGLVRAAPLA
jgi:uncharacterized protein